MTEPFAKCSVDRSNGSIAITGAAGQLGSELARRLGSAATPIDRKRLDVTDAAAVTALLERLRPSVLINCAAWTAVDPAESSPESCYAANAVAVESLATACEAIGCLLVQVSTDYVFGAHRQRTPLREDDAPAPLSVYGTSKLAGERAAQRCREHLVVRTCGLYSRSASGPVRGRNFADTMLVLARSITDGMPGAPPVLRVVADQHVTPSYVPHVADGILRLLSADRRGTFHVVNAGATTWHGFATELISSAGFDVSIEAITSAEYPTKARRPEWSVLSTQKLSSVGITMPTWQAGIAAYLQSTDPVG